MLNAKTSTAIVAVSDPDRARDFYQNVLGLELIGDGMGGVMTFRTGESELIVYPSRFAGTNQANAVVWSVGGDMEAIVADLRAKGIAFEHYADDEWMQRDGDIHMAGNAKLVWFKDPDGNILHLNGM